MYLFIYFKIFFFSFFGFCTLLLVHKISLLPNAGASALIKILFRKTQWVAFFILSLSLYSLFYFFF